MRELETEQNCNILTRTLLAITAFLSRFPGLLNRGPGGPAFLEYVPQSSNFSPTRLIPNWLTSCLHPGYIIIWRPLEILTLAWRSCKRQNFALIQPVHGQGYNILIFLDRMHLLFTQVHFLFWQPGRVGGQYTTAYQWIHSSFVESLFDFLKAKSAYGTLHNAQKHFTKLKLSMFSHCL